MKTLGVILLTLLMHEQSHCGVLRRDDKAFIRNEISRQLANITSPNQCNNQQLETVLQNQAAMIASQADVIRAVANVNLFFADCLDYRTRGHNSTSGIITTLSQDGECSQESYCDM